MLRSRGGRLTADALVDAVFAAAGVAADGEFDDDATVVVIDTV